MNLEPPRDYANIFDQRGHRYAQAMRRHPMVREREFARLFSHHPVQPGQQVLDVPSGSGYLQQRLKTAQVTALELSGGFSPDIPVVQPLSPWPLPPPPAFDHAVCLAALHHIADAAGFVGHLLKQVKDGGILHLADVPAGSRIARFLDGFISQHNGTGHSGLYRAPDDPMWCRQARLLRAETCQVEWIFASDADMLDFTTDLFGLTGCAPADLQAALESEVGVIRERDQIRLQWALWYADLTPG